MGKFKGFLKRTIGGLALATCWLPAVAGIGGLAGLLSSGISALVFDIKRGDYQESAIYKQEYMRDVDEASQLHLSGELSDEEFYDKLQYFVTDEYKEEVMERPLEENKPYQEAAAKLKTAGQWALGTGVTCGIGGALSFFWYGMDVAEFFDDAATDIFWELKKEKEEEERKKREKEREEEEKEKKAKQKDEFEESEVEEVLPNIEDNYYRE